MYHFCRKIINDYLIKHGYISYSIATHLVKCNVPKQIIKKSEYGRASTLSSRIMCDLKKIKTNILINSIIIFFMKIKVDEFNI